jgi:hypothetical protein
VNLPNSERQEKMSASSASKSGRAMRRQRGFSTFSLTIWATMIGLGALFAMKVFPSVNEYFTIKRAIQKIADSGVENDNEARRDFDKQRSIEYSITTISGADLEIEPGRGKLKISFAYDKEVEIYEPVYLLIKYHGETR